VPVHVRPRSSFPDGTHFVSPSPDAVDADAADEEDADTAAVVEARDTVDAEATDDAAPAPGSAVRTNMPTTAATIPARAAAERRLNLNI
jgi:hypothetical protein